MTLRLPEPLPYDFVDELIDSQFEFKSHEYKDENGWWWVRHAAKPRDARKRKTRNVPRILVQLLDDNKWETISSYEVDDEGYVKDTEMDIGILHRVSRPVTDEKELDKLMLALVPDRPVAHEDEDCYV